MVCWHSCVVCTIHVVAFHFPHRMPGLFFLEASAAQVPILEFRDRFTIGLNCQDFPVAAIPCSLQVGVCLNSARLVDDAACLMYYSDRDLSKADALPHGVFPHVSSIVFLCWVSLGHSPPSLVYFAQTARGSSFGLFSAHAHSYLYFSLTSAQFCNF